MKIKVKKEMTLPELIKWAGENRIKNKKFIGSSGGGIYFYFDEDSWISIDEPKLLEPDETFEVEVEQKVDEETKLPTLIQWFEYGGYGATYIHHNKAIKETIDGLENDLKAKTKAFYILNDDYTMTLIWRNGGMVE